VHLDLLLAVALARLAAAARLVEAEAPRLVAAHLRLRQLREQLPDQVEDAGVRRRVRRRCVADGALIDVDDLVDLLQAEDVVVGRDHRPRPVQPPRQRLIQHLVNKRALARAADAGHGHERPQREAHVDVLQVVLPRPLDDEGRPVFLSLGDAPVRRHRDGLLAGEVLARQRRLAAHHLLRRAAGGDFASAVAGAGTEVE
jgi:hypothetical protein